MDIWFISAVVSALTTACICFLILRWRVLDVPDDRSAHNQPMPTLGGLSILLGMCIVLIFGRQFLVLPTLLPSLGASAAVLCVLVYDEFRPLRRIAKFIIQCIAALVLIGSGVLLRHIDLPFFGVLHLSWAAMPLTLLWLVGVQNLYNFMDGIDGLAGQEGFLVSTLVGGMAVFFSPELAPFCFVLAGSVLGFLVFNFPPARIFMGDVGSHFLGLVLAVLAIWSEQEGMLFWIVVCCLGSFLYDATYTLLRRLLKGENITQAHQFHLYQRLNRMGYSYRCVLNLYGGLTILLGITGYLYLFGYRHFSFGAGCLAVVLMIIGTIWVERKWKVHI